MWALCAPGVCPSRWIVGLVDLHPSRSHVSNPFSWLDGRVRGRGGDDQWADLTRYPRYGVLVTLRRRGSDGHHAPHSRVPPYVEIVRDVSFWRLDHPATCRIDISLAPHRPPFCRLRVFCRGRARAVPTRSTSPVSRSRRLCALHPSHTPIRPRSTADWGVVLQHEARDPGIASGGVMDLFQETPAHPMPLHRPRDSDGNFSTRFRSR